LQSNFVVLYRGAVAPKSDHNAIKPNSSNLVLLAFSTFRWFQSPRVFSSICQIDYSLRSVPSVTLHFLDHVFPPYFQLGYFLNTKITCILMALHFDWLWEHFI
jgi:hypothetical protein